VEEVRELFDVHKRTVRNWVKKGLPTYKDIRPHLILGTDLKLFISNKRKENKHTCKPSEIYCFRCRIPQNPESETVHFIQQSSGIGRVFAVCSVGENAISPTFESKFARLVFVGDNKFNLSYMRHTDKWFELHFGLSSQECFNAIETQPYFVV
jgi:hypothetical protein